MAEIWRLLDSGLASPPRNVALSRALLESRNADECASTLRFARFTRCALIPHDGPAGDTLDLAHCEAQGRPVQRRISGGPTWVLDERQLVFELYLHRRELATAELRALGARICHAAATALAALGCEAQFRPRAEIEIDGRTLASGAFAVDGNAILFQCALTLAGAPADTAHALGVPGGALGEVVRAAVADRLVTLEAALGRAPDLRQIKQNLVEAFESDFDVEFRDGDLTLSEEARYQGAAAQVAAAGWTGLAAESSSALSWLEAAHDTPAGALRVAAAIDRRAQRLRQLRFLGESAKLRACADLEAALADVPLERIERRIDWFFSSRPQAAGAADAAHVRALLQRLLQQPLLAR